MVPFEFILYLMNVSKSNFSICGFLRYLLLCLTVVSFRTEVRGINSCTCKHVFLNWQSIVLCEEQIPNQAT